MTSAFLMFLDVNIDVNTNFYLNMFTVLCVFIGSGELFQTSCFLLL